MEILTPSTLPVGGTLVKFTVRAEDLLVRDRGPQVWQQVGVQDAFDKQIPHLVKGARVVPSEHRAGALFRHEQGMHERSSRRRGSVAIALFPPK